MLSLKQKQSGFTIVELLIVIVIIGILAGLVITTFAGIQQRARDSERQTDINAIQKQLEAYYANVGAYPTQANLESSAFRSGNNIKVDTKALADPSNASVTTFVTTNPLTATSKQYAYIPSPTGCDASTNDSGGTITPTAACTSYKLAAWLESKSAEYIQTSQ